MRHRDMEIDAAVERPDTEQDLGANGGVKEDGLEPSADPPHLAREDHGEAQGNEGPPAMDELHDDWIVDQIGEGDRIKDILFRRVRR